MRIRIDLAYDGTDFHGWAVQPGLRTVEGELTLALSTILRRDVALTVAGRTDAGVHASAQVAHLDLSAEEWGSLPGRSGRSPADSLVSRVNSLVARGAPGPRGVSDIAVSSAREVPDEFDARFSALERSYRYRIDDRAVPDVFQARTAHHHPGLDTAAMVDGAAHLLGEHDFLSFCKPRDGATTIRELTGITIDRPRVGSDAGLVTVDLRADAFCHSMVRSIVAALIEVGSGRRSPGWVGEKLAEESRAAGVGVAPARGLMLTGVRYPDSGFGRQAALARRVREKPLTAAGGNVDPSQSDH